MNLTTTIFIAFGLAADAFTVSLTSGLLIHRIKINKALKIALFFGLFQCIMPLIGWLAGLSFSNLISQVDHWIAFGLLTFIGGKMIYESLETETTVKKYNPLDFYTLLVLAIATSIDALAVGLSFSILKTSILLQAIIIGLITFWLSFIGVFLGHHFGNRLGDKIEILGGVILVAIGSKILIEHLIG
jgi:putative Mn2+ efflux pump MntP